MKITSSLKKGEGVKNNHSDPITLPIILEADALSAQDRREEESRLVRQNKPGKSKKRKGEGENKSPKQKSAGGKTPSANKRDDREENSISLERRNRYDEEEKLIFSEREKGERKVTSSIQNSDDEEEKLSSSKQKKGVRTDTSPTEKRDDEGKKLSSSERKKKRYDEGVRLTSSDRGEGSEVNQDGEAPASFRITPEDVDDDSEATSLSKELQQFTTPTQASSEDSIQIETTLPRTRRVKKV